MTRTAIAARASLVGTGAFLILVGALHVLRPDLGPSWRFISEYAIGPHGWLMQLAFFAWALGWCGLFVAIRPRLQGRSGRAGTAALVVSVLGLVMAGVFVTDPVTAPPGEMTASGRLHALAGMLGMAMPVAVALLTWSLLRGEGPLRVRRRLGLAAGAAVAGFLVSLAWMGALLSASGGAFGPDVPVGWPNRLEVLLYCVWLLAAAWEADRIEEDDIGRATPHHHRYV